MNILKTFCIYILYLIRRIKERKEMEIKIQKIIKINKEKIEKVFSYDFAILLLMKFWINIKVKERNSWK